MVRLLAVSLFVVAMVFALSAPAQGQGFDPKAMFDRAAKGKDYILIADVQYGKDRMEAFAKEKNITNGKLTFDQFKQYNEQRFKDGGGKKGGSKGGGYGRGGGNSGKGGGGSMIDRIGSYFTPPKPGDAKPAAPKPAASSIPSGPTITTRVVSDDELERRPVVYRAGKLPPGLPDWFEKLDKDKDGQVDLGEWRLAGKKIADFAKIDLNKDGLLTPDEVLRYEASERPATPEVASAPAPGAEAASAAENKDEKNKDEKKDAKTK